LLVGDESTRSTVLFPSPVNGWHYPRNHHKQ
jgi:hypothetical protein